MFEHALDCAAGLTPTGVCTCGAWSRQVVEQLQLADRVIPAKPDAVNPGHYRSHASGIECIQVTEHMSFNLGNAVKYIWRVDDKGDPVENLRKSRWYIDREIQRREAVK